MAAANPLPPSLMDDPVLRALDRAPRGERFTPEQEAELALDMEDIRAGRAKLVPHAEVRGEIDRLRRREGG